MKKLKKIIVLPLLITVLSGCNRISVKDGTEAAKILLANERLDGSDLRKDGNIFTKGKKAFERIKTETRKYSKRLEEVDAKSKFNKTGELYSWSEAPDYSNFLSFFDSYAKSIEFNAEVGSKLIDSTKKNVRIVNKWIELSMFTDEEILLLVEENAETIFSRSGQQYEICRRSQNEEGINVFDMFIENFDTNSKSRMHYIPGLRYEYVSLQNDHMLVIYADKDKGYWDIMTTGFNPEYSDYQSFTNLVMKDEAIYELTYSIQDKYEMHGSVEVVTGDGKSDILEYDDNYLSIYTTGINGLDSFYIEASDDEVWDKSLNDGQFPENIGDYKVFVVGEENDKQYFTQAGHSPNVKFTNGKEMFPGQSFYDGAITLESTSIEPIGGIDFYGKMNFSFKENDIDYVFENLKKLSLEYGFTFKDPFEDVYAATKYAAQDKFNFSKYYKWRGYNINDIENLKTLKGIETDLIFDFVDMYNGVKDYEVIRKGEQAKLDSSYHFSNVEVVSKGEIANNGFILNIGNLTLKSLDTILFVNEELYKVEVAVANEEEGEFINIMPLASSNNPKVFSNEATFEATFNGEVNIPLLAEGDYVLVAYIATNEEGIRVTKPVAIEGQIIQVEVSNKGIYNKIYSEDNIIKIESKNDITINITLSGEYSYELLLNELTSYAYNQGMTTDQNIEKLDGSEWIIIGESEEITAGTYRLKYLNSNQEAYVVANVNL